ncbi:hypothetical protein RY831_03350 [Noviherbaspirillum sp. CPCC 100848]|uniref:Uncharacterized protein n=1 Tax=Noviherbaspirillum album TaxID=3080276 RepID=A0ABU6J4M4_9BURK|nr:hypothetical protein [Noviherbaspirillum sp. CPCC 100848]MEC4718169.1 hypothetical protein [Noviherbaspirillum sp. CPCC 100848]
MTRLAKAKLSTANTKSAAGKVAVKLTFGSIPVVSAQDLQRLRRKAKENTNRIFPELPEWQGAK